MLCCCWLVEHWLLMVWCFKAYPLYRNCTLVLRWPSQAHPSRKPAPIFPSACSIAHVTVMRQPVVSVQRCAPVQQAHSHKAQGTLWRRRDKCLLTLPLPASQAGPKLPALAPTPWSLHWHNRTCQHNPNPLLLLQCPVGARQRAQAIILRALSPYH